MSWLVPSRSFEKFEPSFGRLVYQGGWPSTIKGWTGTTSIPGLGQPSISLLIASELDVDLESYRPILEGLCDHWVSIRQQISREALATYAALYADQFKSSGRAIPSTEQEAWSTLTVERLILTDRIDEYNAIIEFEMNLELIEILGDHSFRALLDGSTLYCLELGG
jgi:hypothetical protein